MYIGGKSMKLFISKQVFKENENGVKIEPLDENRTQLTVYHTVKKEEGKEITPFIFRLAINFEKLTKMSDNILLNFEEVKVNKNEEAFKRKEKEEVIYALLFYKEVNPLESLCIPVDKEDRVKVIYTLQLEDGVTKLYFIKVKLLPMQSLTIHLLSEQGVTMAYKYLEFKRNAEDKIEVEDFYVGEINSDQYISLSELGGLEI